MKTRTLVSIVIFILTILIIYGVSAAGTDFIFVGISDTHINSEKELDTLRDFLYTVQQTESPDMVIILGDIVDHHAPEYLPRVKQVIDNSNADVRILPGNHDDTSGFAPEPWQEAIGDLYYAFDHKGWKIIMNWSQNQPIDWLTTTLDAVPASTPVIFCQHYPIQAYYPETELLMNFPNVQIAFGGHMHSRDSRVVEGIPRELLPNVSFDMPGQRYYVITAHDGVPFTFVEKQLDNLTLLSPPDDVPVISLTSPAGNSTISGNVQFSGTASDDSAVVSIQYRVNRGAWQAITVQSSWDVDVDTAMFEDGRHLFEFRALDDAGQESIYYAEGFYKIE
jgi:predicted phosphodiesterase